MWRLARFVLRGRVRRKVLTNLSKPMTATYLSKLLKVHRSSVSRALLDLQEEGLVKCLNSEDNLLRFYERTEKGKEILNYIKGY